MPGVNVSEPHECETVVPSPAPSPLASSSLSVPDRARYPEFLMHYIPNIHILTSGSEDSEEECEVPDWKSIFILQWVAFSALGGDSERNWS